MLLIISLNIVMFIKDVATNKEVHDELIIISFSDYIY